MSPPSEDASPSGDRPSGPRVDVVGAAAPPADRPSATRVDVVGAAAPPADRPSATRVDVIGAVAIVFGTGLLAFGPGLVARLSAHPSAAECDGLLAHYVELKERAVSEKLDAKSYAAALEDARSLAGPTFAACTTEVTLEEAECARHAGYADEMERCLR